MTDTHVELAAAHRLIRDTHRRAVVHTDCTKPHCPICEGGLFVCADCGAAEADAEQHICTGPIQRAETAEARLKQAVEVMRPFAEAREKSPQYFREHIFGAHVDAAVAFIKEQTDADK